MDNDKTRLGHKYWHLITIGLFCVLGVVIYTRNSVSSSTPQRIPDVVDFNFHIRPILSDRCFKCHGPDANKRKADLRLDTEDGVYQALKDNRAARVVVPGNSEDSELYRRLQQEDTSQIMPPPN